MPNTKKAQLLYLLPLVIKE